VEDAGSMRSCQGAVRELSGGKKNPPGSPEKKIIYFLLNVNVV
jgi:hypothetical protein|tara:strand:+ start:20333 stop:20461 length:129 start_codon:yes stop_codon:yes gene_type:complete